MNEIDILDQTYFDEAMILRLEKGKDENGQTKTGYKIIRENIKCAISKDSGQALTEGDVSSVNYSIKLFCNPNVDIIPGDKVKILSLGSISTYIAGESFVYASHIETPLTRKLRV